MINFEYQGQALAVPDGWADITLGHYETFYNDRPQSPREQVDWVARVCRADPAVLLAFPAEVFGEIVARLSFLFGDNPATPDPCITVRGVRYIVPIEEKLSTGAWIDIDAAQKEGKAVLSTVLAVACRFAGEEYDSDRTPARQALFAALPMDKVQGALAFFLKCKTVSDKRMDAFAKLVAACDHLPPSTFLLRKGGGGTMWWPSWRGIRYWLLTAYLKRRLRRLSRSWNT